MVAVKCPRAITRYSHLPVLEESETPLKSTESYLQHLQLRVQIYLVANDDIDTETINNIPHYTLVDVRSKPPEQHVSVIPNATTILPLHLLDQFEANDLKHRNIARKNNKYAKQSRHFETIHHNRKYTLRWCMIGYRSGLEAQRLRDQYNLNVRNLDGSHRRLYTRMHWLL